MTRSRLRAGVWAAAAAWAIAVPVWAELVLE